MGFEVDPMGTCQIEDAVYPTVGFGTFPLKGDVCFKAVLEAGKLDRGNFD